MAEGRTPTGASTMVGSYPGADPGRCCSSISEKVGAPELLAQICLLRRIASCTDVLQGGVAQKDVHLRANPLRDQRLQAPEVAVADAKRLETGDGLPQILRT